jgi:hypothetical protein
MKKIGITVFLTLLPFPIMALDFGVDGHAGSMGIGAGAALQLTRHVNMRVGLNKWEFDVDIDDEDGLDYDGEFELNNQYVMLDFYPGRNGSFHVTAGLYLNDNEIRGKATVLDDGSTEIGNSPVFAGTQAKGAINFDNEAGYLGIGWGNTFSRGLFSFGFDLGLVYQGSPNADFSVVLPEAVAAACEIDPNSPGCVSEEDIRIEEQELEDELSDYDVHPLVQATFAFSF